MNKSWCGHYKCAQPGDQVGHNKVNSNRIVLNKISDIHKTTFRNEYLYLIEAQKPQGNFIHKEARHREQEEKLMSKRAECLSQPVSQSIEIWINEN